MQYFASWIFDLSLKFHCKLLFYGVYLETWAKVYSFLKGHRWQTKEMSLLSLYTGVWVSQRQWQSCKDGPLLIKASSLKLPTQPTGRSTKESPLLFSELGFLASWMLESCNLQLSKFCFLNFLNLWDLLFSPGGIFQFRVIAT